MVSYGRGFGISLQAQAVKDGLLKNGLINRESDIVSFWRYRAKHGYPIPTIERDTALNAVLPFLESRNIYSRGRFGLWKYEVSNQDHSFMHG